LEPGIPVVERAEPAQALFQRQWRIYRKLVENNYLFHREAYDQLHRILVDEVARPFRFLDVACGDASASIVALKGTRIAHYHGIDSCKTALELARETLRTLACPVTLDQSDFVKALCDQSEAVDVAWIGLSLHHLLTPEKLTVMRQIRSTVGDHGRFLIYEDASPDGEDREAWLRRWDLQEPSWIAFTAEEWEAVTAHVHAADFPETASTWNWLGYEAGFERVRQLFVSPTDLFRMYCFEA
jgi:SAM-dependent methyltransferase